MTDKTIATNSNGQPVKPEGWFSWRHRTNEAHVAARENYLSQHGPAARRKKAAARHRLGQKASTMTPEDRLLWAIFGGDSAARESTARTDDAARRVGIEVAGL